MDRQSIRLKGDRIVVIEPEIGEVPEGKEVFQPESPFKYVSDTSWKYLSSLLTPEEYWAALKLGFMAEDVTNVIPQLSDTTPNGDLAAALGVSIDNVTEVIDRLRSLGVFGSFGVQKINPPSPKFWVFNPYLSFSSEGVDVRVWHLFRGTHVYQAYVDPKYKDAPNRVK